MSCIAAIINGLFTSAILVSSKCTCVCETCSLKRVWYNRMLELLLNDIFGYMLYFFKHLRRH